MQPRGKQYWKKGVDTCLYIASSGIWQTVYLEAVSELRVEYIHITPDIDRGTATAEIMLNEIPKQEATLSLQVKLVEKHIRTVTATTQRRSCTITVDMVCNDSLNPLLLWSPCSPHLYDMRAQLIQNAVVTDQVDTYFGMRKIEVRDGVVYLNNNRIYQRLILDQGYWPDTMITPPSDEAIREDLEWTKNSVITGQESTRKLRILVITIGQIKWVFWFGEKSPVPLCLPIKQ